MSVFVYTCVCVCTRESVCSIHSPGGGPYVSLVLFSTLASKFLWTSMEVVREEKFTFNNIYSRQQNNSPYLKTCTQRVKVEQAYCSVRIQLSEKVLCGCCL